MVRSTRLGGHKEMLSDRNYIWMLEDRVKRRDKDNTGTVSGNRGLEGKIA